MSESSTRIMLRPDDPSTMSKKVLAAVVLLAVVAIYLVRR